MTTGQFMSLTIGCDVEVRQLQRLRVIDVYEQREGALLRYLEALLARSDVDLSVAVERDARRGITIAAQLMRLRSHGALLRPFVEDCLRGASDGYSVNAFAADLLKLLVWIRGAGRPQFLLERFGYMPGSGSIIEPDCAPSRSVDCRALSATTRCA